MGLDISVYKNLVKEQDDDNVEIYINNHSSQAERCTMFEDGPYTGERVHDFSAGAYSSYNRYREALAALVGVTPSQVWDEPTMFKNLPFYEQIDFSDCEGTLDYRVSEVLYNAYKEHEVKASESMNESQLRVYADFMEAFKLAYENKGVVEFH